MMLSEGFIITLSSPGAIALKLGDIYIRWYGIFIALGFLLAYLTAEHLIKKEGYDVNAFSDLVLIILVVSIVCARAWFVLFNLEYFKYYPSEMPKIWYGGQSIHGAIIGGISAGLIFSKLKKLSFYTYMDIIAVVMPLAQSIGRWGNFFNNEAFGLPVKNFFLRLSVPPEDRPVEYFSDQFFHPTFLYESFFDFIIFIFLFKKYNSWKKDSGKLFWSYLLLYSIVRFFIELIRIDSLFIFPNIPIAQFISIIFILISSFILLKKRDKLAN